MLSREALQCLQIRGVRLSLSPPPPCRVSLLSPGPHFVSLLLFPQPGVLLTLVNPQPCSSLFSSRVQVRQGDTRDSLLRRLAKVNRLIKGQSPLEFS